MQAEPDAGRFGLISSNQTRFRKASLGDSRFTRIRSLAEMAELYKDFAAKSLGISCRNLFFAAAKAAACFFSAISVAVGR